jgi:hypothetical protein
LTISVLGVLYQRFQPAFSPKDQSEGRLKRPTGSEP